MQTIKSLIIKYKELILYVVFGVLTTLVNLAVYWLLAHPLGINETVSTAIAWLASVAFAYVTNRRYVFESKKQGRDIIKEALSFMLGRVFTGILDTAIMYVFVQRLSWSDMPVKLASNVIVIILNFVISKLLVFKKTAK